MKTAAEMLASFPPEDEVFPLRGVEITVHEGEMPFLSAERQAISDNWREEVARNPALFDGKMLLNHGVSLEAGMLRTAAHIIPYSAFLWWRKRQPRAGGVHIFAFPVIESADGALIAVRMGAHTANAGQVYFAAGSFDESDVVDGYCDIEGNMRREVMEETGLDLAADAVAAPVLHACHYGGSVALLQVYRFRENAEEIVRRVNRHIPLAEDQEISEVVVIRSARPDAYSYNRLMLPVLEWYFSRVRPDAC